MTGSTEDDKKKKKNVTATECGGYRSMCEPYRKPMNARTAASDSASHSEAISIATKKHVARGNVSHRSAVIRA